MMGRFASPADAVLQLGELDDLRRWRAANDDQFTLVDYPYGTASVGLAIAFSRLFWPDLVEHAGGIFLAEGFSETVYDAWVVHLGNHVAAIERVINHRHLADLLPGTADISLNNLRYLGDTVADMRHARLGQSFPDRRFEVSCAGEQGTEAVEVTFFQAG